MTYTLRPLTVAEFWAFRAVHDQLKSEQGWPATDWDRYEPMLQTFDDGQRFIYWVRK